MDTSALVPKGHRRNLEEGARGGTFLVLWSPGIIGDLYRVLTWRWLARTRDFSTLNELRCSRSAKAMMDVLVRSFEIVAPVPPYPPAWPSLTDSDDFPVWSATKIGGARYVVSENSRDFPPRGPDGRHVYEGIEYLPARAFLERLTQGEA